MSTSPRPPDPVSTPPPMSGTTWVDAVPLARLAVEAATAVPGVRRLDLRRGREHATYGRGERVEGARVRYVEGGWKVHVKVVAAYGPHLPDLARTVQDAVRDALPVAARVDIAVSDIERPAG